MKRSNIIYLLGLMLALTATAGCAKASMGSKGGQKPAVLKRVDNTTRSTTASYPAPADQGQQQAPAKNDENDKAKNDKPKDDKAKDDKATGTESGAKIIVVEEKNKSKPFDSISSQAPRALKSTLSYSNETEQKESNETRGLLSEIWSKSDVMKGQRAVNVGDENYEVNNISTEKFPYVSNSLFHAIIPAPYLAESEKFYPCDLNTIGSCLVLEKDFVRGKAVMKAYVVGSALKDEKSQEVRIVRRDFTDKTLVAKIAAILKSKTDGIYIYSLAATREETVDLQSSLISAEEAKEMIAADAAGPKLDAIDSKIEIVTDQSEKARLQSHIASVVEKSTIHKANGVSNFAFNKCAVTSVESEKNPNHGMKTVRRIFILDFVNVIGMLQGKEELPLKIGKGLLACNLWNGDVQRVHIVIKEFVSPFTVGVVLSRGKQNLVAGGIGYANGARDILEIKNYGYIVQGEGLQVLAASALGLTGWGLVASAFAGNLAVAPITLSGSVDHKPILAGVLSYSLRWAMPNVRVSFGGRYEITIDPDDT